MNSQTVFTAAESASGLAVYEPYRAQLAELRAHNAAVVFDYEDPAGNKEARSHIYKLRRTKTGVDDARKAAGKDALEYKRKVDAQGKEIIGEIEAMIKVHLEPIEAIEERERQRVADLENRVRNIQEFARCEGLGAAGIAVQIENLQAITVDQSFQEFQEAAANAKHEVLEHLHSSLARQQAREAEQAELEKLRQEAAERERREHEARIAKEAEERVRREAEERAQRERAEQQRREADRAHRGRINASARDAFIAGGMAPDQAELAVVLIAKGSVSNVHISY